MKHPRFMYAAQGVAASLLLFAACMKFMGAADSIEVFRSLGMGSGGRLLIATLELTAALLLLSPLAAIGSLLAVGVMCGAIIAHVTVLGLVVHGDGGLMVGALFVVLVCSIYVLISRRSQLPIVGDTL